jgi:hypothetical protein
MASFIIFMPLSLNVYFAHVNGYYMGIFASIRLLFSSLVLILLWKISLTIATHGKRLNIVGSKQCLQT